MFFLQALFLALATNAQLLAEEKECKNACGTKSCSYYGSRKTICLVPKLKPSYSNRSFSSEEVMGIEKREKSVEVLASPHEGITNFDLVDGEDVVWIGSFLNNSELWLHSVPVIQNFSCVCTDAWMRRESRKAYMPSLGFPPFHSFCNQNSNFNDLPVCRFADILENRKLPKGFRPVCVTEVEEGVSAGGGCALVEDLPTLPQLWKQIFGLDHLPPSQSQSPILRTELHVKNALTIVYCADFEYCNSPAENNWETRGIGTLGRRLRTFQRHVVDFEGKFKSGWESVDGCAFWEKLSQGSTQFYSSVPLTIFSFIVYQLA